LHNSCVQPTSLIRKNAEEGRVSYDITRAWIGVEFRCILQEVVRVDIVIQAI